MWTRMFTTYSIDITAFPTLSINQNPNKSTKAIADHSLIKANHPTTGAPNKHMGVHMYTR